MSAFGGIYSFDDISQNKTIVAKLGIGLAARGLDGGREVFDGPIGMVYRAFHTNRESHTEIQPVISSNGHILTWDGRLDNRSELLNLLQDELKGNYADADIVITAFEKWGNDFLTKLVGDFALAIWNSFTQSILLARDTFGPRPLYYLYTEKHLVWSSDINPLLEIHSTNLEINNEYIANYLVYETEPGQSPFKSIRTVLPGYYVEFDRHSQKKHKYWNLNPKHTIHYKSDSEYEEHFRELFRQSVSRRLRSDRPVMAELSGGLDSSSIVCVGHELLKKGFNNGNNLETISYVYDGAKTSDERPYITSVEEVIGKSGIHLREYDMGIAAPLLNHMKPGIPSGLICVSGQYNRVEEEMNKHNTRILLSGHGGDHMLWSDVEASPELSDLFYRMKYFQLHHKIKEWGLSTKKPYHTLFWSGVIKPIIPPSIKLRFSPPVSLPEWINRSFAKEYELRKRGHGDLDTFGYKLPSRHEQIKMLLGAIRVSASNHIRSLISIETSYPFLDKSLVEYLMAIPFEQLIRPGVTRSLHRRSLKNILPDKVAYRRCKSGAAEAIFRGIANQWSHLFPILKQAYVCEYGYMDSKQLLHAFEGARHGQVHNVYILIKTLSLELWLRSLNHHGAYVNEATNTHRLHVGAGGM